MLGKEEELNHGETKAPLGQCVDLQLNYFRINFSMRFQVQDFKVKGNHGVLSKAAV